MRRIRLVVICVGLVLAGCGAAAPAPPATPTAEPQATTAAAVAPSAVPAIPATPTLAPTAMPPAGSAAPSPTAGSMATPRPAVTRPALGPLTLMLSEPAEDTVEVAAGAGRVTVAGLTRPDAVLSVNGRLVAPDATGAFRVEVPLDDELSLVEVIASDAAGQLLREQFVIVRAD